MPNVRIYVDRSIDEQKLKRLLEEAGCPAAEGDRVNESAEEGDEAEASSQIDIENVVDADGACEPDVLVIVLTPQVCSGDDVEEELKKAINSRCRVVAIWPEDGPGDTALPEIFKKYGASEVIWNSQDVADVICGGKTVHKEPSGKARETVTTDRNCN